MVRESLVLLQNKSNALPLMKSGQQILLAGNAANDVGKQCGGWTVYWQGGEGDITKGTSVLKALRAEAGTENVHVYSGSTDLDQIDVAVVVTGESPYAEGVGDSESLYINFRDEALIKELFHKGIPVVTVIISGRPLDISSILNYSSAISAAWLPGTEGAGITDVLFGDYMPTGKLGHSWFRNIKQIPINVGDQNYDPLFAYGHGLESFEDDGVIAAARLLDAKVDFSGAYILAAFDQDIIIPEDAHGFSVSSNKSGALGITSVSHPQNEPFHLKIFVDRAIASNEVITLSYNSGNFLTKHSLPIENFSRAITNQVPAVVHKIPTKIEAESYTIMSGVQTENTSDTGGGLNVGWIDTGDALKYYVEVDLSADYPFSFRVAGNGGKVQIAIENENIDFKKEVVFAATGGWQTWKTVTETVTLEKGKYLLSFIVLQGGFNLNWININNGVVTSLPSSEEDDVSIYPNPSSKEVHIRLPESIERKMAKAEIYSADGRVVFSSSDIELVNLHASRLSRGFYMVKICFTDRPCSTYKFIRN
jgi:hypothetical protein